MNTDGRTGGDHGAARMAIKAAFDEYFASYRLSLPVKCLTRRTGGFEQGGWEIAYRFAAEGGVEFLELFASHRMTNDRLYRVSADGRRGFGAVG